MVRAQPVLGFAPWIIYWIVADGPSTWMFGAICAVVSAFILGISAGRGGPRLLEVVTIVFFIGVTVAGMIVGAEDRDWMDRYATTLSGGVLAVMALGSLCSCRSPSSTPRSPHHAMSGEGGVPAHQSGSHADVGLVFALIAVLGYVAVTAPMTVSWTKAVIPAVVIVGAIGMTQIYPDRARAKAEQRA